MNPAAILALLSDLYAQVTQLSQENEELRARVEQAERRMADGRTTAVSD